jgi:hypothetical protein
MTRDSKVNFVTRLQPGYLQFKSQQKYFCLLQNVQTGSGSTYLASYSLGAGTLFLGGQEAGV